VLFSGSRRSSSGSPAAGVPAGTLFSAPLSFVEGTRRPAVAYGFAAQKPHTSRGREGDRDRERKRSLTMPTVTVTAVLGRERGNTDLPPPRERGPRPDNRTSLLRVPPRAALRFSLLSTHASLPLRRFSHLTFLSPREPCGLRAFSWRCKRDKELPHLLSRVPEET